ncbi:MAG: putative DNA binding domain-containing protein [Armatimonadetes bacterium]|nr:putative DNA binding domain-containing protein [Armatimonadota bacterium]
MAELGLEQVIGWVAAGESETQEFKRSTGQCGAAARTLSAMLNQQGGRVVFVVEPGTGKVQGQQVGSRTLDDLATELALIEPRTTPTIECVDTADGCQVIVVTVGAGATPPYTYRGTLYHRVGATTHAAGRGDYERRVLEVHYQSTRWETQIAEGWTIADLDTAELVVTVDEAIRRGRAEDPGTREPEALLRGLGLMRNGQLLRAAVVLFGREARLLPDYPQALLRLARFRGTDRSEFVDNRRYHGHAFELLLRADRFLRDHLPIAGRVVPGLFERVDEPLYPPAAMREAVANALCHRDYSLVGGSVGVAIYDDRLEISSSGSLHFGLTVDDLLRDHDSLPWNPLIAAVFYRRGIIETWGRGTVKIVELTQQAGLPAPEFEEQASTVVVRFRPSGYVPPLPVGQDLSEVQRAILGFLHAAGPARLAEVKDHLADRPLERRVRDELQLLKKLGLVNISGHGRGARWHVVTG